jgi:2,4-dienoyl-CoA reductase-like NADH-dependent reductase (Old Yellow Enzyme family)
MGVYPYQDLYMLAAARQFIPLMKNTKLILLGGITDREHVETGLAEGFAFVAMGRALLREPDRVKSMMADAASRSRCTHNNKCMVTVFGRTHCVLDPVQRYGQAGRPTASVAENLS